MRNMKRLEFMRLNKNDEEFETRWHEHRLSRCDCRPVEDKRGGNHSLLTRKGTVCRWGPAVLHLQMWDEPEEMAPTSSNLQPGRFGLDMKNSFLGASCKLLSKSLSDTVDSLSLVIVWEHNVLFHLWEHEHTIELQSMKRENSVYGIIPIIRSQPNQSWYFSPQGFA